MSHSTLEQADEDVLDFEVSDEALETAALGNEKAAAQTIPVALICIPFSPRN